MKTLTNLDGKRNGLPVLLAALAMAWLQAAGAQTALAQNAKLDLSRLDKLASKASEVVNVNLEGPMLQLAAEQMSAKTKSSAKNLAQQETGKLRVADILRRLKGIYVRTFEFSKPGEYSKADVASVLEQLRIGGWKPVINVEEKEEKKGSGTADIYVMDEGGETVGIAIVAAEPEELVVVNLVGPIDFSTLGGFGGGLGVLSGLAGNSGALKPQLQRRDQSGQTAVDRAKELRRETEQQREHSNQKPTNQGDSK